MSDYLTENAYDMPFMNKNESDLMKDENNGMTEFVDLRAKMYAEDG